MFLGYYVRGYAPLRGVTPVELEQRLAYLPPPDAVFLTEGGLQGGEVVRQFEDPNCTGRMYTHGLGVSFIHRVVVEGSALAYRALSVPSNAPRWSQFARGYPNDCENFSVAPTTYAAHELVPAAINAVDWTSRWQLSFGPPP